MRRPPQACLGHAASNTAVAGQPDGDLAEQRGDRVLTIILDPAGRATAAALRTVHGLDPGLRGDNLPLDAGQELLALGQAQTQAAQIGKGVGLGDPHDIGAVFFALSSDADQPHDPGHVASTSAGIQARKYLFRSRTPNLAAVPQSLGLHRRDLGRHEPTRRYGRCARGLRLRASVPHGHWKLTTLVAGLRTAGISAPYVFEGAINGQRFRAYIEQMLAPTLAPGDIVLLDNLRSHKVAGIAEAITARGAHLIYLPPYSPDLNPIEQAFAKYKALLRKAAERTVESLWQTIGRIADLFSPAECRNFFNSAGYAT